MNRPNSLTFSSGTEGQVNSSSFRLSSYFKHGFVFFSPVNDNVWIEYGRQHLTFYDLQSFTKNDVQRVEINLPMRQFTMDQPDPGMGSLYAMSVVSACFTNTGEFYVLDNQLGLHIVSLVLN